MFVFLLDPKVPEILFGSGSGVSGSGPDGPNETDAQLLMVPSPQEFGLLTERFFTGTFALGEM